MQRPTHDGTRPSRLAWRVEQHPTRAPASGEAGHVIGKVTLTGGRPMP